MDAIRKVGRGRAIGLAVLGVVLLAIPASAAAATTLTRGGATINYSADPGQTNTLTIARSGANYVFTDAPAVTITPSLPCASVAANVATCPVTGTTSITASLNNLGDIASVADSVTDDLDQRDPVRRRRKRHPHRRQERPHPGHR